MRNRRLFEITYREFRYTWEETKQPREVSPFTDMPDDVWEWIQKNVDESTQFYTMESEYPMEHGQSHRIITVTVYEAD